MRRHADDRDRPRKPRRRDRTAIRRGRFTTETEEPCVICGCCLARFQRPRHKADHLVIAHGAKIERHVTPDGIEEYHWRLQP